MSGCEQSSEQSHPKWPVHPLPHLTLAPLGPHGRIVFAWRCLSRLSSSTSEIHLCFIHSLAANATSLQARTRSDGVAITLLLSGTLRMLGSLPTSTPIAS